MGKGGSDGVPSIQNSNKTPYKFLNDLVEEETLSSPHNVFYVHETGAVPLQTIRNETRRNKTSLGRVTAQPPEFQCSYQSYVVKNCWPTRGIHADTKQRLTEGHDWHNQKRLCIDAIQPLVSPRPRPCPLLPPLQQLSCQSLDALVKCRRDDRGIVGVEGVHQQLRSERKHTAPWDGEKGWTM